MKEGPEREDVPDIVAYPASERGLNRRWESHARCR
jgi:hypothetical protein